MSDIFAKLFEIDGKQVLFFTEVDPENDKRTKLNQMVSIDGLRINIAGGNIDKDGHEIIATIDEASARSVLDLATKLVRDAT